MLFDTPEFTFASNDPFKNSNGTFANPVRVFFERHKGNTYHGVIYLFHGGNSSATTWSFGYMKDFATSALDAGFDLVAMDSYERLEIHNKHRWDLTHIPQLASPTIGNNDLENIYSAHDKLSTHPKGYGTDAKLYAYGFSSGGSFVGKMLVPLSKGLPENSGKLHNSIKFSAVAISGASGGSPKSTPPVKTIISTSSPFVQRMEFSDNTPATGIDHSDYEFPTIFNIPKNDWKADARITENKYHVLIVRGVDAKLNIRPEYRVMPNSFEWIFKNDFPDYAVRSYDVFNILRTKPSTPSLGPALIDNVGRFQYVLKSRNDRFDYTGLTDHDYWRSGVETYLSGLPGINNTTKKFYYENIEKELTYLFGGHMIPIEYIGETLDFFKNH